MGGPEVVGVALDHGGVFDHAAEGLVVDGVLQAVDLVVGVADAAGLLDVALDVGLEAVAQHGDGAVGHGGDVAHAPGDGFGLAEAQVDAGDALGVVPDAFEVGDDHEGAHDGAQVGGEGLLGGDDEDRLFLDIEALLIDGGVFFDNALGPLEVGRTQGLDAVDHRLLGHGAENEDIVLEVGELLVEELSGHGAPPF